MGAVAIREKLQEYIRFANDKKVKKIYAMVEQDIEEDKKWWEDKKLIAELDKDYNDFKNGKAKGFTMDEVKQNILALKAKRSKAK